MKNVFFIFIINFLCYQLLFSQTQVEIPNYLLAENSNFIVNIITTQSLKGKYKNDFVYFPSNSYKKISSEETPDEKKFFDFLCQQINDELKKLNMYPAGYINFDAMAMFNTDRQADIAEQYAENNPGFVLNFGFNDLNKAFKDYKKGNLLLEKVSPVALSIMKTGETDYTKLYYLPKINLSVKEAIDELKREIDKKGKDYFIDKMYIDNKISENFNLEAERTMKKENNSINDFPKEDDLKNNNILVVTYAEKDKLHYKNSIKFLDKFYPYKYTLITIDEFPQYIDKGYKYALVSKRDFFEKTESYNGKVYVSEIYKYYYVIKDLETRDMYYGLDKEKLINKENVSPARALKTTLEMMLDYYKWTEKE